MSGGGDKKKSPSPGFQLTQRMVGEITGKNDGNFSSQQAKADKGKEPKRLRKLLGHLASADGVDERTRAELIAKANLGTGGAHRRGIMDLLTQAQSGTNPIYRERANLQEAKERLRDQPGRRGLFGI